MKKIINYFKSWGMDKWAHFGIGGLICALSTLIPHGRKRTDWTIQW